MPILNEHPKALSSYSVLYFQIKRTTFCSKKAGLPQPAAVNHRQSDVEGVVLAFERPTNFANGSGAGRGEL